MLTVHSLKTFNSTQCKMCFFIFHGLTLLSIGLLQDDIDPMVSVMKVEKAPLESYADISGLDAHI